MGSVFEEFDLKHEPLTEETRTSRKRKAIFGGLVLVAAIVLILLIGVPLGVKKSDAEPAVAAATTQEGDRPKGMTSLMPSSSPTILKSPISTLDSKPSTPPFPTTQSPSVVVRATPNPSHVISPYGSPTPNPSSYNASTEKPYPPWSTPSPTLLTTSKPVSPPPTSAPAPNSTNSPPTNPPTRTATKVPTARPVRISTTETPTQTPATMTPTSDTFEPSTFYPTYSPTGFLTVAPSVSTLTRNGSFYALQSIAHDQGAFTEGLVTAFRDNKTLFYEGTGYYNRSTLRKWDPIQQAVLLEVELEPQYFGEGVTFFQTVDGQARILQLTWMEQTAFVYDADTLDLLSQFTFNTTTNEGWGVTHEPQENVFYVTDGSAFLYVWNASTFAEIRRVMVTLQNGYVTPVDKLNELEWDPISGTILANVWLKNIIARIDPVTGYILTVYDMESLYVNRPTGTDVMNGIALVLNETNGAVVPNEYWVTGKLWPVMFHVRLADL